MPDNQPTALPDLSLDLKSGPRTSEFWIGLLSTGISLAVAVASLFRVNFDPTGLQAVVPSVAVIAAALSSMLYTHARATVKASVNQASAQVLATREAASGPLPTVSPGGIPAADAAQNAAALALGQALLQAVRAAQVPTQAPTQVPLPVPTTDGIPPDGVHIAAARRRWRRPQAHLN